MPELNYCLEINLTKAKWAPSKISDIPELISRAFETQVTLQDIRPLIGTDHVVKWPLNQDSDIPVFLTAKSQMREAFAEKVIKFTNPRGLMPPKWQPKKVKILATGRRLMKYFGEDAMGTREVQVSVKFFDCGHFYMKQSLPGSGACPYQIVFEGRWEETEKGFRFTYLLRYTGQTSKKSDMDLSISALPPGQESFMAAAGEFDNKNQINGLVPATVGEDQFSRVELFREPDVVEKAPARFNEDCPDPPSWKDPTPTGFKKKKQEEPAEETVPEGTGGEPRAATAAEELRDQTEPKAEPRRYEPRNFEPRQFESRFKDTLPEREAPRLRSAYQGGAGSSNSQVASSSGKHEQGQSSNSSRTGSSSAAEACSPGASTAAASSANGRASSAFAGAKESTPLEKDEEPMWPMLIGLAIFVLIFALFGWQNYQERFGGRRSAPAEPALPPGVEEW